MMRWGNLVCSEDGVTSLVDRDQTHLARSACASSPFSSAERRAPSAMTAQLERTPLHSALFSCILSYFFVSSWFIVTPISMHILSIQKKQKAFLVSPHPIAMLNVRLASAASIIASPLSHLYSTQIIPALDTTFETGTASEISGRH